MAASATTWPAAVSERSHPTIHGAPRQAVVLAAFPSALYLQVGGHADVLPVVTRHGLRLPTALVLATDLTTVGWSAQPGDVVVVGGGEVHLPGVTIRAVRTWRPQPVPRAVAPSATATAARLLSTAPLPWRSPARAVTELLVGGPGPQILGERVGALVGAGAGLTPSGDDVLCGVLLGLRLHQRGSTDLVADLWGAVRPRLAATTSLSAALLREAADGYAVEPVARLLAHLAAPGSSAGRASGSSAGRASGEAPLAEAVRRVLAIGHTSGADLLGGLAGCLDALTATTGPTAGRTRRQHDLTTAATPRSLP